MSSKSQLRRRLALTQCKAGSVGQPHARTKVAMALRTLGSAHVFMLLVRPYEPQTETHDGERWGRGTTGVLGGAGNPATSAARAPTGSPAISTCWEDSNDGSITPASACTGISRLPRDRAISTSAAHHRDVR